MNNRNPPQPISLTDLSDFLKEDSSFAFEMRVREIFSSKDLRFEHGGTYPDPHTGVPRQFDLQADLNCRLWKSPLRLFLAIECKSLSEYAPMLVYRCPRSVYEAGHQLIATTCGDRDKILRALKVDPPNFGLQSQTGPFPSICTLGVSPRASRYPSDEAVGKAIDIVGKDGNGKFRAGDKEVYGRWTQALQSVSSMLEKVNGEFYEGNPFVLNWFLPILVVPDDRLFVVDFADDGSQLGDPKNISRTPFFVDYTPPGVSFKGPAFKFSHLEIVTYSALKNFVSCITGNDMQHFLDREVNERGCHEALSWF